MIAVNQLGSDIVTDNPWSASLKPAPGIAVTAAVAKAVVPDIFERLQLKLSMLKGLSSEQRASMMGPENWQLLHQLDNWLQDAFRGLPPAK